MLRGWSFLAFACFAACRSQAQNIWVVEKDRQVASEANDAVGVYCLDIKAGDVDKESAQNALKAGVGGDNIMLEILKEAKDQDDLQNVAQEKLTPAWAASKVGPIIMSILVLVTWPFCMFFSSCCCRRLCRCGSSRHKNTHLLCKGIVLVVIVLLGLALVVAAALGKKGYDNGKDGFATSACTGARLLNTTLSGQDDPYFMGMMPTLDQFYALEQKLETGSNFLTDLDLILDSTKPIQDSVDVASGTLGLLRDMFQHPANKHPKDGANTDLQHECVLCEKTATALDGAIAALNSGVGSALANARGEVAKQMSPQQRQNLQKTIRDGSGSLIEMKKTFRDTFHSLIDPNGFQSIQKLMEREVLAALNVLFVLAFMLILCAAGSSCCWIKEDTGAGGEELWKSVYTCSCCVWGCGFPYIFAAFLIGGLLTVVSAPMSGMCLIMDDLNRDMLLEIGPAMGMADFNTPNGAMLLDMVDNCVVPADPTANANFMDIIYTTDENGTKTYMRQQIIDQVTKPIDDQFANVATMLAGDLTVENDPSLVDLRKMLREDPMDALLLPKSTLSADITYSNFGSDSRGSHDGMLGLQKGWFTSTKCSDHTSAQIASLNLPFDPIPGMTGFMNLVPKYGTLANSILAGTGCLKTVTCHGGLSAPDLAACNAVNDFVLLKQSLMNANTFRCDLFEKDDGSTCDPYFMVQHGATWTGDCVRADGTLKTKQIPCDLAGFTNYVHQFDERIRKVTARLDATVLATKDNINAGLKSLVDRHIVNLIVGIVNGMNCGFLPQVYRGIIKGMCYQGVVGMSQIGNSYVAAAVIIMFLMVVSYGLWRRSIDNFNIPNDNKKVHPDPVVPS